MRRVIEEANDDVDVTEGVYVFVVDEDDILSDVCVEYCDDVVD